MNLTGQSIGGTQESQQNFIDTISQDRSTSRRAPDRYSPRKAPIANQFALGYTYHDVLDADHEGMQTSRRSEDLVLIGADLLARISLHLLSDPSPAFIQLLKPLLRAESIPNTLIVVLLDWGQASQWLRQLRTWLRLLRPLLESLDNDCQDAMEALMTSWRKRGRESGGTSTEAASSTDGGASLPLGTGEWDDPLGLPLCVVCQNVSIRSVEVIITAGLMMGRRIKWSHWTRTRTGGSRTLILCSRICEQSC